MICGKRRIKIGIVMSIDEEKVKEEREFQVEMLKVQIKHDINSDLLMLFTLLLSALIALGTTYLALGITTNNQNFLISGVFCLTGFALLLAITIRIILNNLNVGGLKENLEKELQPIRNKFINRTPNSKKEAG